MLSSKNDCTIPVLINLDGDNLVSSVPALISSAWSGNVASIGCCTSSPSAKRKQGRHHERLGSPII
eukprot:11158314-Prorocentrum_lima.AAC.1